MQLFLYSKSSLIIVSESDSLKAGYGIFEKSLVFILSKQISKFSSTSNTTQLLTLNLSINKDAIVFPPENSIMASLLFIISSAKIF